MASSRIEQMIEDIYDYLDSCSSSLFSQGKITVSRDRLYELLDELKLRTPDEIRRYQKIINNRDAIIKDAEAKAAQILQDAEERAKQMVSESEIMIRVTNEAQQFVNQTYAEAERIKREAEEEAEFKRNAAEEDSAALRDGALNYAKEKISIIENLFLNAFEVMENKNRTMLETLQDNIAVIGDNKRVLLEQIDEREKMRAVEARNAMSENDYNFDENQFLDDID